MSQFDSRLQIRLLRSGDPILIGYILYWRVYFLIFCVVTTYWVLSTVVIGLGQGHVDYQIHSNNDLLEWRQLLLKGASRFKIDPHYLAPQFCSELGETSPNGCLLLNHDRPVVSFNQLYNSTDDLLNFLTETINNEPELLPGKLTIALCFKEAPDYCSEESAVFQSWLNLVDDFYAKATTFVDPTKVEFVLDGDAKPMNCLVGRWSSWYSVWINTNGPQEAFTSDSIENDYYRFQILNDKEDFSNWTWMVENNYGKFSDSSYPYQLWEPDAQEDILSYIDLYNSGEKHEPGFHFAINIDIAMFEIYAKNATGRAINNPMVNTEFAKSAVIDDIRSVKEDRFCNIVFYALSSPLLALKYSVVCTISSSVSQYPSSSETVATSELPEEATNWLLKNYESLDGVLVGLDTTENNPSFSDLILLSNSGRFILVRMESVNYTLSQLLLGTFPYLPTGRYHDLRAADCGEFRWLYDVQNDASLCALVLTSSVIGNRFELSVGFYQLIVTDESVNIVLNEAWKIEPPSVQNEDGITDSKFVILKTKIAKNEQFSTLVVFSAVDGVVYGTTLCKEGSESCQSVVQWSALSVGNHISVSEAEGVLMMVNDFGFCYNSHTKNTRSYPTVCGASPVPTKDVLDYSIGLVSSWLQILDSSPCVYDSMSINPCTALSSCHSSILHGSFDQGSYPSLSMNCRKFSNSLVDEGNFCFFMEVHQGLSASEVSDLSAVPRFIHDSLSMSGVKSVPTEHDNGCGIPLASDSLVLDSFDINGWIHALRRQEESNVKKK